MSCSVVIQQKVQNNQDYIPPYSLFTYWMRTLLLCMPEKNIWKQRLQKKQLVEINLRIVGRLESHWFNVRYRKRIGATNILSFPMCFPPILGDLVMCAPLINQEAGDKNIGHIAHWAHLYVHGILHLMGWDHCYLSDAKDMEQVEVYILNILGFSNPYH